VEAQSQVVARLEEGSRPEEIRRARAELSAALAESENSALQARRRRPLADQNAISREEAQKAGYGAEAAQARVKAAKETLQLAIEGPRKEDIASAKATLRALEAQLALARQKLADASLYAPSDGVIQDRISEPGDMASPQKPVYTIALTDPLWVRTYVSEPDLGKVWLGMSARVMTDSFPGKEYSAWVGFISPTAQFTPKAVETTEVRTTLVYQARVFVCNPQDELRLGMPATVTIPLNQPKTTSTDPAQRCKKE
jgi:HlyD family secretion protein